jgi:histidinol-phosphate aminotransferase
MSKMADLGFFNQQALAAESYTLLEPDGAARMHQNEGIAIDKSVQAGIAQALSEAVLNERNLSLYPTLHSQPLQQLYTGFLGIPETHLLLTSGSSQGIATIALGCFAPGKKIAVPAPTFSIYEHYANLYNCEVLRIPLNEKMEYTLEALLSKNVLACDVIFLCTPNNPTGTTIPADWIRELRKKTEALVVVDEAYIEFDPELESLIKDACVFDNLLVLRTLSKAWGVAGLRMGGIVSNPRTQKIFHALRPPYAFSYLSEVAATYVLKNCQDILKENVQFTINQRNHIAESLADLPEIDIFHSRANFVCFRHPRTVEFEEYLRTKYNILVRVYGKQGPAKFILRASIWNEETNKSFVRAARYFFRLSAGEEAQ